MQTPGSDEAASKITRSRAMAVGAHQNRVMIYRLKGMAQIRQEVQKPGGLDDKEFRPILEVSHFGSCLRSY